MKRLRSLLGGSRGKMVMARTREPDVEPVTLYKVLPVRTESTFDEHSPPDKDDTDRPVVIDEYVGFALGFLRVRVIWGAETGFNLFH